MTTISIHSDGQSGDYSAVQYAKTRSANGGSIQIQLTDVTLLDDGMGSAGAVWNSPCHFYVEAIDAGNGSVLGGGHVYKNWGSYSGWVTIANLGGLRGFKLRVRASVTRTWNPIPNGDPAYYQRPMYHSWTANLSYNG